MGELLDKKDVGWVGLLFVIQIFKVLFQNKMIQCVKKKNY